MQQIICIDDKYDNETLLFWKQNGVKHPIEGKLYTIRERIKDSSGNVGIRVNEIQNPSMEVTHPILGKIMWEATFHIRRFTDLLGNQLEERVKRTKYEEV